MILREKIAYVILLLVLFTIMINLGTINSYLSFQTDKTLQFDESIYVVPDYWNTTDEFNTSGKNGNAMTNGYVIFDAWMIGLKIIWVLNPKPGWNPWKTVDM